MPIGTMAFTRVSTAAAMYAAMARLLWPTITNFSMGAISVCWRASLVKATIASIPRMTAFTLGISTGHSGCSASWTNLYQLQALRASSPSTYLPSFPKLKGALGTLAMTAVTVPERAAISLAAHVSSSPISTKRMARSAFLPPAAYVSGTKTLSTCVQASLRVSFAIQAWLLSFSMYSVRDTLPLLSGLGPISTPQEKAPSSNLTYRSMQSKPWQPCSAGIGL
mmetsp:Transcript_118018/g.314016  ORF Transcript_118018/g.314016 Transcript_118018/m.314016 type:complete len:223 (+) Transcript_118018:893-1561(+)